MSGRTILDDLKQSKEELSAKARGEEAPAPASEESTPESETTDEVSASTTTEQTETTETTTPVAAAGDDEDAGTIRIGDQEFKTQAEALDYARKLEQDKMINEAYNMGIKETLQSVRPETATPPPEDNFEEKFYTDPKGTLKKIKEEAREEALAAVRADENAKELWNKFLTDYPDIEKRDAQRILREEWEVLGQMKDTEKAMKILAQKTRAEYQRMADRLKPRSELPPNRSTQAVSAGRGGVTPPTTPAAAKKPLTLAEEMRMLRRR